MSVNYYNFSKINMNMNNTSEHKISVLIIDDEVDVGYMISHILNQAGYITYTATDGNKGIALFNEKCPDAVILDLRMPCMNGMDVLRQIKHVNDSVPVIIITAYGEIQSAVEAIKFGAYDFLKKPFANDELVLAVKRAVEEKAMRNEIQKLKTQLGVTMPLIEQMGSSAEIARLNAQIECVAPTNFTVVIYGETGSGKELVARGIHNRSSRKDKSFVVVDCGSIPETLIESELFGYEKGTFTGADQKKIGQFEMASGGTLFLDEIGNLPRSMQGKLLRVLQERRIRRLGSSKEIEVDVRVVVAGNERLETLVNAGHFRMDLYQRLNEFCIEIPPLRQRKEDIIYLSQRFLDITNGELKKNIQEIAKDALEKLLTYDWPGNVRELKNVIKRAVLLASDIIETKHLLINELEHKKKPGYMMEQTTSIVHGATRHTISLDFDINNGKDISLHNSVSRCIESAEIIMITDALKHTNGNKSRAAKILKIDNKTLHYKIKKYGITVQPMIEVAHPIPSVSCID